MRGNRIRKNTKKHKTLKFLAQGKSQSWIVEENGYDKSVVCRYTKYFMEKKWLICTTPHCHDKKYRATPKAPLTTEEKGQPIDTILHKGVYTRNEIDKGHKKGNIVISVI